QNYVFPPTFVTDVTASWKTKMKATAAFKSQFYDPKSKEPKTVLSDPKFMEMIDARGRHFGALIGARYGEGFLTKQPPRIDDVIAAYSGREV
ncbi:MAG TPA: bacillithiol biosynthesis deacetylase BshB1, partial [Thermoanaerobaculia bacterium]